MMPAFANAMPIEGFIGGLLIGIAAAIMLLGLGRIAGVSGLVARAARVSESAAPRKVAIAFVVGLPLGAGLVSLRTGGVAVHFPASTSALIIGGLLVGLGTRMGSGCTSGHGVCGMSRLSRPSIVATVLFMGAGFATVAMLRAVDFIR